MDGGGSEDGVRHDEGDAPHAVEAGVGSQERGDVDGGLGARRTRRI